VASDQSRLPVLHAALAATRLTDDLLAELLATAQEQLRWQRAAVLPEVRKTIEATLTTMQLRQAYEMCDGTKAGTEIAKAVGSSKQTVSRWAQRWRDLWHRLRHRWASQAPNQPLGRWPVARG
jgi:hypothetical protein